MVVPDVPFGALATVTVFDDPRCRGRWRQRDGRARWIPGDRHRTPALIPRSSGEPAGERSVTSPDGALVTDPRAAGDLTRRALLGTAAAAGAASLVLPGEGLASALTGPTGISSRWVGSVDRRAVTITAPVRFALVGRRVGRSAHGQNRAAHANARRRVGPLGARLDPRSRPRPRTRRRRPPRRRARRLAVRRGDLDRNRRQRAGARRPTDPRRPPALRQRARAVERIGGRRAPASAPRTRRRAGAAADHRALGVGSGPGAAALPGRLRLRPAGVRPPHRHSQRLLPRRRPGDADVDLPLPPLRARLERHRLQLRDRPLRADLGGSRRRASTRP